MRAKNLAALLVALSTTVAAQSPPQSEYDVVGEDTAPIGTINLNKINQTVVPVISRILLERQQPDFPLEELIPEQYREGRRSKMRWIANPSPYDYACTVETGFGKYFVTYCLAQEDSGSSILAVRMKFPAQQQVGDNISSLVMASDIEVIAYNRQLELNNDLVSKEDTVKMTMKGMNGIPDVVYMSGFAEGKIAMQSWYIDTCDAFTEFQNQEHHDNPNWLQRIGINLRWKKRASFYNGIFQNGTNDMAIIQQLSEVLEAALGRFTTRLGDDANEGLYRGNLTYQKEICSQNID
jgi:hypothetical protein